MTTMTDMIETFGEPISMYTSDQAVDDGMLVEAAPDQFGTSLLVTRAVFDAVWPPELVLDALEPGEPDTSRQPRHEDGRTYLQRMIPLLQDAAMIAQAHAKRHPRWGGEIITKGLEGNVTGQEVWIARNDRGGLTLMFPSDN